MVLSPVIDAMTLSASHGRLNRLCDAGHAFEGKLVLPNADNLPTLTPQRSTLAAVPSAVVGNFLIPPCAVHAWCSKMCRATVPVAAVNENADPRASKDYVRSAPHACIDIDVLSKSHSFFVQFTSQQSFQGRIKGSICLHHPTYLR